MSAFLRVRERFVQVFLYMSHSLHASMSDLGALSLSRSLAQALSSPLAGVVGDLNDRTNVVLLGCFSWGIMTSCIAFSSSLGSSMVCCALNGLALAIVIPNVSSLTAESVSAQVRGRAFGFMGFTATLGGLLGAYVATNFGGHVILGMEGWRVVFHVVALASFLSGILVKVFARDPRERMQVPYGDCCSSAVKHRLHRLKSTLVYLFGIQSFSIIILQGIVGSIPWQAMTLFTVWLQILGFKASQASALVALFSLGCAVGNIIGGWLGDEIGSRYENHGRIWVGQVSILCGLPICNVLCTRLTPPCMSDIATPSSWGAYGSTMLILGLMSSWCGANNSAIFADIVPRDMMTQVYAFDRTFEGGIGAVGAPLVGFIASTMFGFSSTLEDALHDEESQRQAAMALSSALLWCLTVPWILCLLFYSLLHHSFPRDRNNKIEHNIMKKNTKWDGAVASLSSQTFV